MTTDGNPTPGGPPQTPPPMMQVPPTTALPPQPPAKGGNRRNLMLGCLGALVLGCGGVGAFAFFDIQARERAYAAANQLYQAGDCAAAVTAYDALSGIDGDSEDETLEKARAERAECVDYLDGVTAQDEGRSGDALITYSTFIEKYPDSPALPRLREQVDTLYAETASADLVNNDVCTNIDGLNDKELIIDPDTRIPDMLLVCGQLFEAADDFANALLAYQRFRDEYPDNPQFEQATAGLARAAVADARASGAGEIPPPQSVSSGGNGDTAVIVIQNDTPERLSLIFSGPDVRVETLEPCTECQNFSVAPTGCPELGPVGSYTVAPGDYEVVVRASSDGDVTPFRGSWTIGGGEEYYSCFYLVTQ
jgi:tetratricopeptide (TPR) repeat protein